MLQPGEEKKSRNEGVTATNSEDAQSVVFSANSSLRVNLKGANTEEASCESEALTSPSSPAKVDLTGEASEFIVKEKCLNPQIQQLEVIQENHSEFSNSQSILDSVSRSDATRKARLARRKAN